MHNDQGRLVGYNTDGDGFMGPLVAAGFDVRHKQVVVLGAGGAARSVVSRLVREDATVLLVIRTRERAERLAAHARESVPAARIDCLDLDDEAGMVDSLVGAELLVNTTSVGMHPHADALPPIPPSALHSKLFVYDLVYNPADTPLLRAARAAGSRTLGGLSMLVYQGAAAFKVWTGVAPPVDVMREAAEAGLRFERPR